MTHDVTRLRAIAEDVNSLCRTAPDDWTHRLARTLGSAIDALADAPASAPADGAAEREE